MQRYAFLSDLFLLMLLFTFLSVPSTEATLTWNTQQVKEYVWAGGDCPIAVDQNGNVHIAYLDGDALVYAVYDGHEWSNQTIASNGIYFIFGLVLDSRSYPHLLYEKKLAGPLLIASWNGEAWDTLDTGVAYTDFAALAVDSFGNPNIVYTTFTTNINHTDWAKNTVNASLKFARWTGNGWSTQTVDTVMKDSLSSISLSLGRNNTAYILYSPSSDTNNIKLATETSAWKTQNAQLPPLSGNGGNVVVDSKGYAHFLCTQPYQNSTSLRTILYATFNLSAWNMQTVALGIDLGTVANLALDSLDNPHFTYSINDGDSMYVAYSGDRWHNATLPDGIIADNLALDASGNPYLLYRTYSPARFCSHLLYASATGEMTDPLTSAYNPDITVWSVAVLLFGVVLAAIVSVVVWRKRALKDAQ